MESGRKRPCQPLVFTVVCVHTRKQVCIHAWTHKSNKEKRNIQEQYLEGKSLVNRQNRILKQGTILPTPHLQSCHLHDSTHPLQEARPTGSCRPHLCRAGFHFTVHLPRRCANSESWGRGAGSGMLWLRHWAGKVLHEDSIQKVPLTQEKTYLGTLKSV